MMGTIFMDVAILSKCKVDTKLSYQRRGYLSGDEFHVIKDGRFYFFDNNANTVSPLDTDVSARPYPG